MVDPSKLFPRHFDMGFNKGQSYYEDCIPRDRLPRGSAFKEKDQRTAYSMGVLEGYDQAERDDYTTKEIK